MHAISSKISPVPQSSGIEVVQGNDVKIFCKSTLTGLCRLLKANLSGIKFLLVTDAAHPNGESLTRVYQIYADYVVKNPFHTLEMPIRSDLFDAQLQRLITGLNSIGPSAG